MDEGIRLNKYLASCGVCSRRDADKLIEAGVVCVDGETASPGRRVTGAEQITVRGKLLQGPDEKVVLAYYKPLGVVCSERDAHAARLVTKELGHQAVAVMPSCNNIVLNVHLHRGYRCRSPLRD